VLTPSESETSTLVFVHAIAVIAVFAQEKKTSAILGRNTGLLITLLFLSH
jgi:hypothetical protein